MKRLHLLIGGLALLLILCSTRSVEGFDNKDSCNYDTQNLDGKARVITYNGEKYFWIIAINILTIKDNPSCEPKIEGKIIKIPKDKIPHFNKSIDPNSPSEGMAEDDHRRFLENLMENKPELIKKILDNKKACDTHTVSDLK